METWEFWEHVESVAGRDSQCHCPLTPCNSFYLPLTPLYTKTIVCTPVLLYYRTPKKTTPKKPLDLSGEPSFLLAMALLCSRRPCFFCSNRPADFAVDVFLAVASSVFDSQFHVALCGGFGVVEMAANGLDDEKMRVRLKKSTSKFCHDKKCLYLCNRLRQATRALSSAGLEHLPYKQRVGGSNPSAPTRVRDISTAGVSFAFTAFRAVAGSVAAGGSRLHENLPVACRTRWGIREAGGNGWHGFHTGSVPKTT